MTHPVELQRRNMIEYQQIDNQGNTPLKEDGTSKVPDYINNLFMEEYKEKIQAKNDILQLKHFENIFSEKFQKQITIIAQENLADAEGDMLICIAGAMIQHKIPLKIMKNFNAKPFQKDNISVIQPIERVIERLNEATTIFEKAVLFENLWFGVVNEALDNNFDIEGIYNAIAENNLVRIDRDENGIPKTDANGKIMRKDMHPDLKPFIL